MANFAFGINSRFDYFFIVFKNMDIVKKLFNNLSNEEILQQFKDTYPTPLFLAKSSANPSSDKMLAFHTTIDSDNIVSIINWATSFNLVPQETIVQAILKTLHEGGHPEVAADVVALLNFSTHPIMQLQ